jgi:hypothetical protein
MDWYLLLAPLLLAVLALPFLFVGCGSFGTAESPPQPGEPAPPPAPVNPDTVFLLNLDSTLQAIFPGATTTGRVVEATVRFELFDAKAPTVGAIALGPIVLKTTKMPPPSPPELDPATDGPAQAKVPTASLGAQDTVRCACDVRLAGGVVITAQDATAEIGKGYEHVFRLVPAVVAGAPGQRGFKVVFEKRDGT